MNVRKAIELVRREHDIRLAPDDPILVSSTIAEESVRETVKTIEGMLKAAADRMAADQVKANEDAEARGKALISRGAQWLDEQWKETAKEAAQSVLFDLRQEREKVAQLAAAARRAGWVAGGCAAVTAAGLAGWMMNALATVFK